MAPLEVFQAENVSAVGRQGERRWKWIEDVPDYLAVCEFACGKLQCREFCWQTCERRLRGFTGINHSLIQWNL